MNTLISAMLASLAAATLMTMLPDEKQNQKDEPVQLGTFCLSLSVKDIKASKAFYEKLDFEVVNGNIEQKWLVLQNGTTKVALMQGLIERNTLTFNPGVTPMRETLEDFQDVRELQGTLKARGIEFRTEADETTTGPAYFEIVDPDGNPILVDQGVPKPKR